MKKNLKIEDKCEYSNDYTVKNLFTQIMKGRSNGKYQ